MITNRTYSKPFRYWAILIIWLTTLGALRAADPSVTMRVPGVVEVGERFEIEIVVNARPSSLTPPSFADFRLLGGPSTSQSSSFSIVNGKTSQSIETSYSYVVAATKPGKLTLQPARAVVDGKEYVSPSYTIEVVAASGNSGGVASSNPSGQAGQTQSGEGSPSSQSGNTLYIRLIPEKNTLYQGEPLAVTLKIFSREQLVSLGNLTFPDLAGFFRQDIEIPALDRLERENVNGTLYNTGVLARFVLFPQKSGELGIGSFGVDCGIQEAGPAPTGSLFDDFFGSQRTIQRTLSSTPAQIKVLPLPTGAPDSFSGAVGNFQLSLSADKVQLKAHEAFSVTVEIKGEGNVRLLDAPPMLFPPEFETYDPKITTEIEPSGLRGTKRFEYLIIPRRSGSFSIAPATFSFFNPRNKQYASVTSSALQIEVAEGQEGSLSVGAERQSGQNVQELGKDIRFIKTGRPDFHIAGSFFFGSLLFWLWILIPLALFITGVIVRRKRIMKYADAVVMKHHKANKFASKRLKSAAVLMQKGFPEPFYEEVSRAMWGYLSDKLSIPTSELSREKAVTSLRNLGVDNGLIEEVVQWLDACEYARYAPAATRMEMHDLYRAAEMLIGKMQVVIRELMKGKKR